MVQIGEKVQRKESELKKLMLLVALLAMLALSAVPAVAQVSQENEQDADSGDLNQSSRVTQSGDNSVQCVGEQLTGNTGNAQTSTQILQYGSEAEDFDFDDVGSSIDVSPVNSTDCTGSVNQIANAKG